MERKRGSSGCWHIGSASGFRPSLSRKFHSLSTRELMWVTGERSRCHCCFAILRAFTVSERKRKRNLPSFSSHLCQIRLLINQSSVKESKRRPVFIIIVLIVVVSIIHNIRACSPSLGETFFQRDIVLSITSNVSAVAKLLFAFRRNQNPRLVVTRNTSWRR